MMGIIRFFFFSAAPALLLLQTTTTLLLLLNNTLQHTVYGFHHVKNLGTRRRSRFGLYAGSSTLQEIQIGPEIGSGSYGTVHHATIHDNEKVVAKRAWNRQEIDEMMNKASLDIDGSKERADRYANYLEVEYHCFKKLNKLGLDSQMPKLRGQFLDNQGNKWIAFNAVMSAESRAAVSLNDALKWELEDIHNADSLPEGRHRLSVLVEELGLPGSTGFDDALDHIFSSMIRALTNVHKGNVCHRDIKPDNFLIDPISNNLILIDFGSAADMDPSSSAKDSLLSSLGIGTGGRVGLNGNIVAVSPTYSAPEVFVRWDRSPLEFDVFSLAMVFTQILFSLFDQRTDAAFRKQLEDCDYDLDLWLSREMESKLRPAGLDDAILYLGERPGMWKLLKDMFQRKPERRPSSKQVKSTFLAMMDRKSTDTLQRVEEVDGPYFDLVLDATENCVMPEAYEVTGYALEGLVVKPRPLHYVATFDRSEPLGLILSERDVDIDEEETDSMLKELWKQATFDGNPGEVFIKGLAEGGQAEEMGIFEVGDRLVGVGDVAFDNRGFERFVSMLQKQPQSAKTVALHFDRKSVATSPILSSKRVADSVAVSDHGAWTATGKRKTQEDRFVLQEFHEVGHRHVLMAGVFDGHGGDAASETVKSILPKRVGEELDIKGSTLEDALSKAWTITCDSYRSGCDGDSELCLAHYDEIEGILEANTGSADLIAGTTAATALISLEGDCDEIVLLNCGDSRAILIGEPREKTSTGFFQKQPSFVHFRTKDHSPSDKAEQQRLLDGIEAGLNYSPVECSTSRYWLKVGDYQYAVSRSLEGKFATSRGIISSPDTSSISLKEMLGTRDQCALVIASDGVFERLDNEEIGRNIVKLRNQGASAAEAAKFLCGEALRKGTLDNVSAVVVYFNEPSL